MYQDILLINYYYEVLMFDLEMMRTFLAYLIADEPNIFPQDLKDEWQRLKDTEGYDESMLRYFVNFWSKEFIYRTFWISCENDNERFNKLIAKYEK